MNFVFSRRFLPLFVTQFFGAFNDNFLKNALLITVAFRIAAGSESFAGTVSNIAAGLFILPYFLFSSLAGQLADKYDRAGYMRIVKFAEILLMLAAAAGFLFQSLWILLPVLFLMGAQSAFFSPAKFSVLPELLHGDELLGGNAWLGGGTYLAILSGAICGGLAVTLPHGDFVCGAILIAVACAGYWSSCAIPSIPPADVSLKIGWNLFRKSYEILSEAVWKQKTVRECVLSNSVFWMAASLYITQTPLYTKNVLRGDEVVSTFFFVLFSIGVGTGAFLADWVFRSGRARPGGRVTVLAIVGMALFTADLSIAAWTMSGTGAPATLAGFFHEPRLWRASVCLFCIALCGGVWSVPLQTLMQKRSGRSVLSRVIAGDNMISSCAMASGSAVTALMMLFGCSAPTVYIVLAGVLVLGAVYSSGIGKD